MTNWIGPGLADTDNLEDIAYGLVSPYLDMSDLSAATEAIEPGLTNHMLGKRKRKPVAKAAEAPKAAGIAVRAADTGRVLMIQRALTASDPAAGTWEFPGGKLNNGEHPHDAAKREWQEETGQRLPRGQHAGEWRSGVYHGFVHEIPREAAVKINSDHEDRRVLNPDDPDGDQIETMAWIHPEQMRRNSSLRPELRRAKAWAKVEKGDAHAATLHLRVHGVSRTPSNHHVYRMVTRDGHYVGRTLPTRHRARKGDVLKVQANDLLQDAQGDLRWMNAAVVSGYNDSPHSWRDLEAMAGGALAKDGAPGTAGDIPPAGDEGTDRNTPNAETLDQMPAAAAAGTGPSASSVHIDVPLRNISVGYQTARRWKGKSVLRGEFLPIGKAQAMKQLVYGVVLEPNSFDSQDDFMLPHHVERSAHNYLKKAIRGQSSVAKLQHRKVGFKRTAPSIVPVESFIAPVDFHVEGIDEPIKKGSWVMCMHVEDPALWQDFLDGKYTGFSVGGTGVRQSLHASAGLSEHDLIGRQVPSGFSPELYAALSPRNG